MLAVIPVRDGDLPAGADETLAECDGVGWLVGSGTGDVELSAAATALTRVELGTYRPARWSAALARALADHGATIVVLPHSPDGRDLAPRLAHELDRPLLAGAVRVSPRRVSLARHGGLEEHVVVPSGPFVATFQPGVRGVDPVATGDPCVDELQVDVLGTDEQVADVSVLDVLPPDVHTMDLAEARRIVGGGAGLDSVERFTQLGAFAAAIDGSVGATRVITDRSWIPHDKQIGTTGVVVDPDLYLAFGISGAVQHTSGLGDPDHVISVNTDPHCPMMQMSDLAIESDANATLEALLELLELDGGPGGG
jgi:electron transfer flavoprotein alpha subunit